MSRVAKKPIALPGSVKVSITGQKLAIQGPKGNFEYDVHEYVKVAQHENALNVGLCEEKLRKLPSKVRSSRLVSSIAGTMRSIINSFVIGVSDGFEKKLQLVGVGYRAQLKGKQLGLTLGFSHPVDYDIPEGIQIEVPEPTVVIVKGADKRLVGAVSAKIRSYRPPEPYKGKGIRYADEYVKRKEAKKK